ncbi:MAG TPA: hypothetical protein VGM73_09135 [Candidatus Didemnitutus sp.]|jgi:hypothetical protein
MKKILTFLAALLFVNISTAQTATDDALYRRLTAEGDDSVAALKEVLARPESVSAALLYVASGAALKEKHLKDSGFLFYVARFRGQFDREMFPPTEAGGDSPMVLLGALQQQMGSVVNPALMAEPKVFAKVLAQVKLWSPQVPVDYSPGWAFSKKGNTEQAEAAFQAGRKKFLGGMEGFCMLLQDDAYFAAFRIVQDYNLKSGSERPSKAAFDTAMKTMERIETEKGIEGIALKSKK